MVEHQKTSDQNQELSDQTKNTPDILSGGKNSAFYVGHHGWPTKKILGFRWSKKTKIMLESKAFGEKFLSVFSNFPHF